MKNKILAIILCVMLIFGMTACSKSSGAEIMLLTDYTSIDDNAFNQIAWEGISAYAKDFKITADHYMLKNTEPESYDEAIAKVISQGAKIVVAPGVTFAKAIFDAQEKYPETTFILLDSAPNNGDKENPVNKVGANTVAVQFAEEQAGYLAGFSAIKEGYSKLGFMGGLDIPPVNRFGYGYIQGVNAAAKEMGLSEPIEIKCNYTGSFAESKESEVLAKTWYKDGTEIIFVCSGSVLNSVVKGSKGTLGKIIGVDTDQNSLSDNIITSATKSIGEAVNGMLFLYYEDKFPGGKLLTLDATSEGTKLAMKTSRFKKFTQKEYDAIYSKMASGELKVSNKDVKLTADLSTDLVKVIIVE